MPDYLYEKLDEQITKTVRSLIEVTDHEPLLETRINAIVAAVLNFSMTVVLEAVNDPSLTPEKLKNFLKAKNDCYARLAQKYGGSSFYAIQE